MAADGDAAVRRPSSAVGIRPAYTLDGRLVWADPAGLPMAVGDWVVVADPDERLGMVIVAPEQVVESALVGPLPPVVRRALPAERPAGQTTAGAALLESLDLADWTVGPPGRGAATEDERDEGEEEGERSGRD